MQIRSSNRRPGRKFSFTYRTNRSTLPFVCGERMWHTFGTNPNSAAKSAKRVFQTGLPSYQERFHVVGEDFPWHTAEIRKSIDDTLLHAAQVASAGKLHVFHAGFSHNHHKRLHLVECSTVVCVMTDALVHLHLFVGW